MSDLMVDETQTVCHLEAYKKTAAAANRRKGGAATKAAIQAAFVSIALVGLLVRGLQAQPIAPNLVSPANGAKSQPITPALTWGIEAGASYYGVQVSTDSNFGSTVFELSASTATAQVADNCVAGTMYYWRVNATDAGGSGPWSGVWSFATAHFNVRYNTGNNMTVFIVPAVPPNISIDDSALRAGDEIGAFNQNGLCVGASAWSGSNSYITIWGNPEYFNGIATTPDEYGIERGEIIQYRIWRASPLNPTDGREAAATPGYAPISAIIQENSPMYASGDVEAFATLTGISVPTLISPANGALGQEMTPALEWTSIAGATSYAVQVSTDVSFGSTVFSEIGISAGATNISTSVAGGLSHGITYYWHAGAKNSGGGGGVSGWSPSWSFTTIALPTLNFPPDSQNVTLPPVLRWNSELDANTYKLEISTSMSFSTTVFGLGGLTETSDTVIGLNYGYTYFWRVGARTPTGISGWSNVWSFVTPVTQAIKLAQNWNIKSISLQPLDSSLSAMIGSPEDFIAIKDIYGHVYLPFYGINQLSTWSMGTGYQIYSQNPDTFIVTGFPVNAAATPISIEKSWNIIAFLPNSEMNVEDALAAIRNQILVAKNNAGEAYIPSLGINQIGNMEVGEGYMVYALQAVTFTYPQVDTGVNKIAVHSSDAASLLRLPALKHYRISMNTGNNATCIGKLVTGGGHPVPDSCEIGAFNKRGILVGAGTVIGGKCAFPVWGNDPQAKSNDGCATNETISFKLWNGNQEYPLEFFADNHSSSRYAANGIFIGTFTVPEELSIKSFDLSNVFPNPFRDHLKVAFDVPAMTGTVSQDIEINVFDFKGNLVQTIAKGQYAAGHHTISWNVLHGRDSYQGSEIYVIRMRAPDFEKRVKIIRVR